MTIDKKKIGLFTLVTLVTGNMIGSGVFLLPSSLAGIGSISLLSWLFTGVGSICLALTFAHISGIIPKAGGPYSYARAVFGDYLGCQTAYTYWFAILAGNAAAVIALVGYLSVFFPALNESWNRFFMATGIIWLLTLINILGVRSAGFVQAITTVLKLIPILFIAFVGWFFIDGHNFFAYTNISHPHVSNFSAISLGAALTFWAFIGLESATVLPGSIKNPTRNIPLATIIGTVLATIAYIFSSAAIMGMIPATELQHSVSPFADAAKIILGPWGKSLIAIGAIISCFGSINGWILLQGQVPKAAADDGLFFKAFSRTNRYHAPAYGLIITSILVTGILLLIVSESLVTQFNIIILLAVTSNVIPYMYTAVADLMCLKDSKDSKIRKVIYAIIAIIGAAFSLWAIYSSGVKTVYYGSVLLLTSVPIYALVVRKQFKIKQT